MMQAPSIEEIVVRQAIPSSDTVRDRFGAVDGLRAIAIAAVLAYEIVRLAPALVAHNAVAAAAAFDASQGFTLFLILSGFTLAYPPLVAYTENGCAYLDIGRFIVKRVLRIYPAYLFALVLAIVVPPLALRYGLPALAGGTRTLAPGALWRNAFFVGDGLGNDGFRALGVFVRCYAVFPFLILLWARARRFYPAVLVLAIVLDAFTGLHASGVGALLPFALGIVAADVRAQNLPAHRFGLPLALIAGGAALRFGPGLANFANAHAPGALRIDPLWAIALFGLVVAIGALSPLERVLSFGPLRLVGVTSFAVSLVVAPVAAFAIRQLAGRLGYAAAAVDALVASLVMGFALYWLVDRSFCDGRLRREIATKLGPQLDSLLARVRAHRVLLGKAPVAVETEIAQTHAEVAFYAPPPRPDTRELAIVSTRTGSAGELAAEILATKKRLSQRSAAFFDEPAPAGRPIAYEKPGFYRKPKALVPADRQAIKMRINSTTRDTAADD